MLNSYLNVSSQEGFLIIIDNSEINTFIQQRCIKLIASKDSKNIDNVTKYLYFKLMLFLFNLLIYLFIYRIYLEFQILDKFCPILINHTSMESLLKKITLMTGFVVQGHVLEWFPKDHVTLKTWIMMIKIQLFQFAKQHIKCLNILK